MIAISDYIPSITLPILDAIYTNDFKTWLIEGGLLFNLVVAGLFIFSITLGKKYVIKIDKKIMNFVDDFKNENRIESWLNSGTNPVLFFW